MSPAALRPAEMAESKTQQAIFITLCAVTGILTEAVGPYFNLSINMLLIRPQKLAADFSGVELVAIAACITTTCTVLGAFLVRRLAPEASGSGVQEIEGTMEGLRVVRWR